MSQAFVDYYRCPELFANFTPAPISPDLPAPCFFNFGADVTCYGRLFLPLRSDAGGPLPDAMTAVAQTDAGWQLPFDPNEAARALRYEQYVEPDRRAGWKKTVRYLYYALRPVLPVRVRRHLQRAWLQTRASEGFPRWPVDRSVDSLFEQLMRLAVRSAAGHRVPFVWFWPEGHTSCAIMTHDVETADGLAFAPELMSINDSFGIKSSFQLIPDARYTVTKEALESFRARGFEVNVHDLKHDGYLFASEAEFRAAAARINSFAVEFDSQGFRSGVLYRNQAWMDALDVAYDMSVPNVARLDPQPGGCCTVMPFFLGNVLELPVTATQDYSLFHVLGTYSHELWDQQIREITGHHGLLNFIVHPDYLASPAARSAYTALLTKLAVLRESAGLWIPLPRELNTWWRERSELRLVQKGSGWRIEGPGAERACIAYASLDGDRLQYSLA